MSGTLIAHRAFPNSPCERMFESIACLPPGAPAAWQSEGGPHGRSEDFGGGAAGAGVSRVYGDPIEVWVTDGRPSRFVWNGRLYTVRRVLDRWVTTRDWWRDRHPGVEEETAREFWRVEAAPEGHVGVYELRHDAATGDWMLSRAWD
jgi:hypothetical protein